MPEKEHGPTDSSLQPTPVHPEKNDFLYNARPVLRAGHTDDIKGSWHIIQEYKVAMISSITISR